MKWHAHHDWAGWSFGLYPTEGDDRMFTLQCIRRYCMNLDLNNLRISWLHREYRPPPWERQERRRGLRRLVIDR